MKYLVVGTGALGSIFGGFLHLSGQEVGFLGRGEHFEHIRRQGLLIRGIWGEHRVSGLKTFSSPREVPSACKVILLCVKSFDTAEAVRQTANLLAEDGLVVSLQNGLGNVEKIAAEVGSRRTLGGRVIFGVEIPRPGEAQVTVCADKVVLGSVGPQGADREKIKQIVEDFCRAHIPTEMVDQIFPFIWAKVLYNCALNPLAALLGVTYGELGENPQTQAIMKEIIAEIYQVAARIGITLPQSSAESYFDHLLNTLIPATASHHASMLQDLRRGKRTEIDALNGAISQMASELGLPAPANLLISRLIHFCESRHTTTGSASR
ncbi:MAG: 2-dehydropantoate 2-reductase [bacterium]|nr:2-dehydropantoate 2-reductase [bacterium]